MIRNVNGIDEEMTAEEIAEFEAGRAANSLIPTGPTSVSARQFKLQLLSAGLLDQVNAWIATQPRSVQIAFEYSGSFVRGEPMMAAGFSAMGFADPQIDAFFEAASKL